MVRSFTNFALAWKEYKNVSRMPRISPQLVHRIGNRMVQVVLA